MLCSCCAGSSDEDVPAAPTTARDEWMLKPMGRSLVGGPSEKEEAERKAKEEADKVGAGRCGHMGMDAWIHGHGHGHGWGARMVA